MVVPRPPLQSAQALARVLVQPTLQPARLNLATKLKTPTVLPVVQIRNASRLSSLRNNQEPRAHSLLCNERIGSFYVNLVEEDGTFLPQQKLTAILKKMDRVSDVLLQVAPRQQDHEHPYPVCRIISKSELREMEREKNRKKKTWNDLTKIVELTWSIAKHDLDTQLKRVVQFLEQDLRVEIVLGPKKFGRTAERDEIEALYNKVTETITSIRGVKEYAKASGELGKVLSLYYVKESAAKGHEKQKEGKEEEEAQKVEDEDKSQKPKKVPRYRIKEEEKRKQAEADAESRRAMAGKRRAAPEGFWSTQREGFRPESAYEREQKRMREERQREGQYVPQDEPPAVQARRRPGSDLGGRTGSLLSNLRGDQS